MIRLLIGLIPLLLPAQQTYYVGFLRAGSNAGKISPEDLKQIQAAHMKHILAMADSGALVGAGPTIGSPTLRGLFIFKTDTIDKARELALADPAVKAGRLKLDIHEWNGPAGLSDEYRSRKRTDPQSPDRMLNTQLVIFKRGPNSNGPSRPDTVLSQALAHGRFAGDSELLGMAVLTLASPDEARRLAESDPAVKSGSVTFELYHWMVAEGVFPRRSGQALAAPDKPRAAARAVS